MMTAHLQNSEGCNFDNQTGFDSIDSALDWAKDRGGKYTVTIRDKDEMIEHIYSIDGIELEYVESCEI